MKTIGMIGGMSWESTSEYYKIINETVKEQLGGLHSAKIWMYSVDFSELEEQQRLAKWHESTEIMIDIAQGLETAGADFLIICTNTMHKMADEVQQRIKIPILHIADATASVIKAKKIHKIGLLGTRFTMEENFYAGRLTHRHGFEVLIPDPPDRQIIHRVIYDELCLGIIREDARKQFIRIMEKLVQQGAEGIILGCTEIGLLIQPDDSQVPLFDTTSIHATAAAKYALEE
jgi:aspartate racemase